MKAVYLAKRAGAEELLFSDVLAPRTGKREVLVEINAEAVTPTELSWFPTFKRPRDYGTLRSFVEAVFDVEKAREACALAQRDGLRGKVASQIQNGAAHGGGSE
jgi:hypothetical protein